MRPRWLLIAVSFLLAFIAGARAEDACAVTTPPNPPFVPPAPYRPNPSDEHFWYGTNELWTLLPVENVWRLDRRNNEGYRNKLFLWQEGWDRRKEPYPPGPDIPVVLKRLDANMPPITSQGGTNAFFDNTWAMLTMLEIPTEGCWEVTAFHKGDKLTFVLSILPPE